MTINKSLKSIVISTGFALALLLTFGGLTASAQTSTTTNTGTTNTTTNTNTTPVNTTTGTGGTVVTPGVPTTGAGAESPANMLLLASSALLLAGGVYGLRKTQRIS